MTARTDLLVQLELIDKEEAEWRDHAACAGRDAETVNLFFPERGHSAREAKAICATCPVWRPCLEYALAHHDRLSIAGGRSEKERRVILQARRLGLPLEITPPQVRIPEPKCTHEFWCAEKELYRRSYNWNEEPAA